ncbi:DUF547 domain-containing protein [Paucihalobacter sp.]|uniref:DUF547 domain-containing protein n=1 Tax=Paucihalobacter sp. TaxID=2850405 RepID=UPI003D161EE6
MKNLSILLILLLLVTGCKSVRTTSIVAKETPKTQTPESAITTQINTNKVIDSVASQTAEKAKTVTQEQTSVIKDTMTIKLEQEATDKTLPKMVEAFNHEDWHKLLQAHVTEQGHVNYKAFKANRQQLNNYINSLAQQLPDDMWTKNDVLAYWINAYNALTVDLILRHYPIKSIKDIKNPWDERLWKLGNKWYNLSEIEHQILRKMEEPRIHFAIVCASFSCPKLQNHAFTSSNLEAQLTESTKAFLADPNRNIITENDLKLSKIFQWFTKDFKQNGSVIDFINGYTDIEISPKAKTSYLDYNWDLNE